MELETKTTEIKYLCNTIKANFIKIGKSLKEIRDNKYYIDTYDSFNQYLLSQEFVFSRRHAYNFIKVYEEFGDRLGNVQQLHKLSLNNFIKIAYVSDKEEREELFERTINTEEKIEKPVELEEFEKQVKRTAQRTDSDLETDTDDLKCKIVRILNKALENKELFFRTKAYLTQEINSAVEMAEKYPGDTEILGLKNALIEGWE